MKVERFSAMAIERAEALIALVGRVNRVEARGVMVRGAGAAAACDMSPKTSERETLVSIVSSMLGILLKI